MSTMPMLPRELSRELFNLRKQHKHLYLIDLSNLQLTNYAPAYGIIRPMTRREFNSIIKEEDPTESIVGSCLLYPDIELYNHFYSFGIDAFIAAAVNKISCFVSEADLINGVITARERVKVLESAIVMHICKAFPAYKPDDIENMVFEEQMNLAAMAELMLGIPIEYENALKPKKKQRQQGEKERRIAKVKEDIQLQRAAHTAAKIEAAKAIHKESFVNEKAISKEDFVSEMNKLNEFLEQDGS